MPSSVLDTLLNLGISLRSTQTWPDGTHVSNEDQPQARNLVQMGLPRDMNFSCVR